MKLIFPIIAILVFNPVRGGPPGDPVYLWPDNVPGETEAKHDPVKTDDTSGNTIRLSEVTNPAILVYEPEASLNNGAGVIICPGGAYNILSFNKEGSEIAQWLNTLGYTAFVLQYRVPQKQAGALMDIQRAIRLVRSKGETWKLNPDKLGIIGFSAGGSLCARASTLYGQETYARIDSSDDLSCRPDFSLLIYPAYLDLGENRSLTPELSVGRNTPPMFVFATADDKYGNSSLVMTSALRDAGVPVELHMMPAGGHGYGLRPGTAAGETWPRLAEIWLRNIIAE